MLFVGALAAVLAVIALLAIWGGLGPKDPPAAAG